VPKRPGTTATRWASPSSSLPSLRATTKTVKRKPADAAERHRQQAATAAKAIGGGVAAVTRWGWRNRRPLGPLYTGGALAGTTALLDSGAVPGGPWPLLAASAAPIAWGVARRAGLLWSYRKHPEQPPALTRWQWAGWSGRLAASGWVPAAALTGWDPVVGESLLAGLAVGSAAWYTHLWQQRAAKPAAEPVPQIAPVPEAAITWQEKIAKQGGALPGSRLDVEAFHADEHGWSTILHLAGDQTWHDAASPQALRIIARHFRVPQTSVSVSAPPTGLLDHAMISVYVTNPLERVQVFDGPTLDPATGWITVGFLPDGTPARWRLWEPKSGVCHGSICGTTGSGKSGLVNVLCAEIVASRLGVLWLADGQGGLSVPEWSQHGVDWFAPDIAKTRTMMQAAERIMMGRNKRRARATWTDEKGRERVGKSWFEPTADEPAIYIILEEAPDLLKDSEIRRIAAYIGKQGRKVGVGLIIVTQVPSMTEFGGGDDSTTLRAMMSTTNIAMFRVSASDRQSRHMGGMSAGLDGISPESIPETFADGTPTKGLGFLRSAAASSTSPMRGKYVEDPYDWALWAEGMRIHLSGGDVEDAGQDYATWRDHLDDDPADAVDDTPVGGLGEGAQVRDMSTTRTHALRVLRGLGDELTTPEVAHRVRAMTGTDVSDNTVVQALRRAESDGHVIRVVPSDGGADRAHRWRAVEFVYESERELADA
jgi:hypothetical protein